MGDANPRVPAHLRRFVVEQDYGQYSAVDQAVWRFALLQTYSRLMETAHPIYREGLAAVGISVDRIPRITEMNDRLARFGWGAVCVDGFIPPRAFQEFQAHGLLPIAADIRTRQHLAYTPAPDIIHEAAGHAPILPHPVYASFLRRIGALGAQAFTVPEEQRVFDAIHDLSEVKEDAAATPQAVERAEAELEAAIAAVPEPSEAARLSRLYWWTAEYGLIGAVDDYKIYGAGLLSSLGESHSCHAPHVRKVPLDERCMELSYDITRAQPQLFVVPSFEALHDVLERAARELAVHRGGAVALERALRSREVASVRFASGAWVVGTVQAAGPDLAHPGWLQFESPCAFAWQGRIGGGTGPVILTGRLDDGGALDLLDAAAVDALCDQRTRRHGLRFASGASVSGRLERAVRAPDGRLMHLELGEVTLTRPGRPPLQMSHYALLSTGDVTTVRAGAVDPAFHPETAFSAERVPRPRQLSPEEQDLLCLYDRAQAAYAAAGDAMPAVFLEVHGEVERQHPSEWLLRWNLLESLGRRGADSSLTRRLRSELEQLEVALEHRQPIASGLAYLGRPRSRKAVG